MAAVLIHIKSKMLLPRDPLAAADALEDPRNELVNRLLEHEKFKSAAQMLLQKQQIEDAVLSNPAIREFMDAEGTCLLYTSRSCLPSACTSPPMPGPRHAAAIRRLACWDGYR